MAALVAQLEENYKLIKRLSGLAGSSSNTMQRRRTPGDVIKGLRIIKATALKPFYIRSDTKE